MKAEINHQETTRSAVFNLLINAPNPMLTFIKTVDVTNLVRISKKKHLKFNMLMNFCVGNAAVSIKEFYILPIGDKLYKFDSIAINLMVPNKCGEVSSCDNYYSNNLKTFNEAYLKYTAEVSTTCINRDLSEECMVIGTSTIIDTDLDAAIGMNSGVYNNPFIIWGRYKKKMFRYYLPISFQFHHVQMDGAHAGRFLANLQTGINELK